MMFICLMSAYFPVLRTLLRSHWLRFRRNTRDMNPLLWAVLALSLAMPAAQIWGFLRTPSSSFMACYLVAFSLAGWHMTRPDRRIVGLLYTPAAYLFAGEYLVLSSPFWLIMAVAGNWPGTGCWWGLVAALSFLPEKKWTSTRQLFWGRWIPAYYFEWIAGMRQSGVLVVFFYLLAIVVTWWVPIAAFFCLWLAFGLVAGFYVRCEPLQVLQAEGLNGRDFLHTKVRRHLWLGNALLAPALLWYGYRYPEHWHLLAAFLVLNNLQFLFFILNKYAHYRPNGLLSAGGVLSSLVNLSVIIPFFAPLPLFLCIRYWDKAIRQTEFYLYAYD